MASIDSTGERTCKLDISRLDIVYVTYCSSEWIDRCFSSYEQSLYPTDQINIVVVDNGSTDDTIEKLKAIKDKSALKFNSFEIVSLGKNTGFGRANNTGFSKGSSDIVCFFNIDTEIFPETLVNLTGEIESSDARAGVWELRQFPYEHPKMYDIVTGNTEWCSGAAFAVRRDVFSKVGGFDKHLFMYTEDVDLSYRIRALGYDLKYTPKAGILHYAYRTANEIKPLQYIGSISNNLLLRYRFGSCRDILKGHKLYFSFLTHRGMFKGSRKALAKAYLKNIITSVIFWLWRFSKKRKVKIKPSFLGLDYAKHRNGAFYEIKHFDQQSDERPLVSVIVRTHSRPAVLRQTLISLRRQTYDNIEIVVFEDGAPTAQAMIENEFSDLNIKYAASGEKIGRSNAGNYAIESASGKYINFLDDDDLFFADHIEVMVKYLLDTNMKAAFALANETAIIVKSKEPYEFEIISEEERYHQKFVRLLLLRSNYIPIQSMLFERELFEKYGGLDPQLDLLEDWDLWVRYALTT
ncbi:MAG: glycosyltransferase family 2 protein, partial [Clostridiales Family XIII bacterium]|nr:glycosyltransferase family 2 protein [Clostridiales Family XIII bacterium]